MTNGWFSYTSPRKGGTHTSSSGPTPSGTAFIGVYHTHGADDPGYDDNEFSSADLMIPWGEKAWLGTPSGSFLKYDGSGPPTKLKKDGGVSGGKCGCGGTNWFGKISG